MTYRRTAEDLMEVAHTERVAAADAALVFDEFYREHIAAVTALAYTLAGSWHVAKDLAQEAFARALRDWEHVGRMLRPDSWVRTAVANLATSRLRRLQAEGRALLRLRIRREPVPDPLPDDLEAFWAAVRSLPRRQAQAVALRYAGDLSIVEIADRMGCAEGTIKASLHKARATLASRMDGGTGKRA
jgi:RNA polymerase sigma-70 factor (ECF subfamily)